MDAFFQFLSTLDDFYWQYFGFLLIVVFGLYFSYRSGFYQIRVLSHLPKTIRALASVTEKELPGVSPIRLYFASIGGMIGLGNIVAVVTALMIGGPGALFWLWIAAFAGMIIKYTEIYLGMKYRKKNANNGYDGGLMFCMPKAFGKRFGLPVAKLAAFLLCIYGVEVYQFTVITDTLDAALPISRELIILPLLALMIYIGIGGVKRLANICTFLMPIFIIFYIIMCLWVIGVNYTLLPEMFKDVFTSAFTGHSAVGGFAGATFLMAAQQGAARAAYSGDIAIGFDSIIQSETKIHDPQYQARLAIVSSITDAFICTLSIMVVYLTGLWRTGQDLKTSEVVRTALAGYIPYADTFIVIIIFLAGFTTIQAYFNVGIKASKFLFPKNGQKLYFAYAILSFWIFAHYDQSKALIIMSLSSGFLILLNLSCIFKLRKDIQFDILKD